MLRIRRPKETFTLIVWAIIIGGGLLGGWLVILDAVTQLIVEVIEKLF